MKLLAVFLLVGLAFASAVPLFDDDLETELDQIADELGDEFIVYSEGGLGAKLRQRFEGFLQKIKKAADEGKGVDKDLFKKAEELYNRLKDLQIQVSDKLKQIFEDLRSRLGGNSLQHADWKDWKDRLRKLRDRIQDHEFDEEKIRTFIENLFGKSEMTNQFLEMLKTKGEKGKQRIIDFINRILGEKQEAFAPQHADFREHLRQLRDRIQNHKFDAERIRALVEKLFGKSEMTDQFLEKLTTAGEKGKQKLIDFINRILGEKQEVFYSLKDRLQEKFEKMMENMKKSIEDGKTVNQNVWKKAQDLYEKLSNLGVEFNEKIKEMYEDLKGKFGQNSVQHVQFAIFSRIKERLENLISRMHKDMEGGKGVRGDLMKKLRDMFEKFTGLGGEMRGKFKEMFERLKSRFDKSSSVQHVQFAIFSRIKERLENMISKMHKDMEGGKGVRGDLMKKLTDVYEKFKGLGGEMNGKFKEMFERLRSKFDKSSPVEHSIKEIYEKVKNFFRDLNIELKDRFVKFGEYVKEQYHKGLDKTKSDIDNIKNIAHEFVEDSRKISKDLAEEALGFFRQYKDDLGHIYKDVVDKVRDILNKDHH